MRSAYSAARRAVAPEIQRKLLPLTPEEVKAIDEWALSKQMPHRVAAMRHLIKIGLQVERKAAPKR